MAKIRTVLIKEVRQFSRDGRIRIFGAIVLILAMSALAFGGAQTYRAQEAREHAQAKSTSQWEEQGEKNPHVAAHYGTHVFAPTSLLTAIDPGVSAYLGRSVKIEAHKRNLANHAAAEDGASVQRMGAFSVASVLLQLVPLLIIALGYGLWTREREGGTLRQLLSTGIDRGTVFWGKVLGLATVLAALLLPAAIVVGCVLAIMGGGHSGTAIRLLFLAIAYIVYFAIFGALALWVSAIARSSRTALVSLVGLWGLFCLIAPRVSSELSVEMRPLPSEAALKRDIAQSLEMGIDGQTERESAIDAMVKDMMAEKGFANTGMLVADAHLTGIELQAEAKWEDDAYDYHVNALNERIQAQEQAAHWLGWLSPYLAMKALSAGLSGTDFAHHRAFTEYAETWRKAFVSKLNRTFAEKAGADGWNYRAGAELWKQAPPFTYREPGPAFAVHTHWQHCLTLCIWLCVSFAGAFFYSRRVQVV